MVSVSVVVVAPTVCGSLPDHIARAFKDICTNPYWANGGILGHVICTRVMTVGYGLSLLILIWNWLPASRLLERESSEQLNGGAGVRVAVGVLVYEGVRVGGGVTVAVGPTS